MNGHIPWMKIHDVHGTRLSAVKNLIDKRDAKEISNKMQKTLGGNMDVCADKCINPDEVTQTLKEMPASETIAGMAEIFKALGDPSRLRIVSALLIREHCVCDLAAICSQSESAVSHQLRILRTLRVVKNRREGKTIYYALDDDHVKHLIQTSLDHISHQSL